MAGDETALPADSPAARLDTLGSGSLAISSAGFSYKGSATAISPNWVLTAGHNLDLNDNGSPDNGLSVSFILRKLKCVTRRDVWPSIGAEPDYTEIA